MPIHSDGHLCSCSRGGEHVGGAPNLPVSSWIQIYHLNTKKFLQILIQVSLYLKQFHSFKTLSLLMPRSQKQINLSNQVLVGITFKKKKFLYIFPYILKHNVNQEKDLLVFPNLSLLFLILDTTASFRPSGWKSALL